MESLAALSIIEFKLEVMLIKILGFNLKQISVKTSHKSNRTSWSYFLNHKQHNLVRFFTDIWCQPSCLYPMVASCNPMPVQCNVVLGTDWALLLWALHCEDHNWGQDCLQRQHSHILHGQHLCHLLVSTLPWISPAWLDICNREIQNINNCSSRAVLCAVDSAQYKWAGRIA